MNDLIVPSRRGFLTGAAALIVAPAIVRAGSLMPIKAPPRIITLAEYNQLLQMKMNEAINRIVQAIESDIIMGTNQTGFWDDRQGIGGSYIQLLNKGAPFALS